MTTYQLSFGISMRTILTSAFTLFLLPFFVLQAQEPAPVTTTDTAATASSTVVTDDTLWYKLEKLSGTVNQGDFVVGPGRAELELKPGQSAVFEISVANRISDNRRFELAVEDVAGTDDAGRAVVFLGDQTGPYTLKDYISFPEKTFTLDLGDRARIPVTITIPEDAEPGGYYGGVLVSTIQDDGINEGAGTARSPIIARVGTLFFITVPGEVVKSGETKSVTLTQNKYWFEKGPIDLSILYENTGSVHLNPYGEVRITNLFNEEVGFVELEPWFVLPKSLRARDVSWNREMLFGRYTATVSINRGYDDIVDTSTVTFYVLPWKIVLGTFVVIFLVLFIFRFLFRNFEFRRRS